jgi:hypothetical protein
VPPIPRTTKVYGLCKSKLKALLEDLTIIVYRTEPCRKRFADLVTRTASSTFTKHNRLTCLKQQAAVGTRYYNFRLWLCGFARRQPFQHADRSLQRDRLHNESCNRHNKKQQPSFLLYIPFRRSNPNGKPTGRSMKHLKHQSDHRRNRKNMFWICFRIQVDQVRNNNLGRIRAIYLCTLET